MTGLLSYKKIEIKVTYSIFIVINHYIYAVKYYVLCNV